MVLSGVFVYGIWRKHLLIRLLRLEYIVLGIYLLFHYAYRGYLVTLRMGYLTFSACEGALGLAVLVTIRRSHGRDYFRSFHIY
jgi:NADH-ubiquinone oxidoreductase chain 4L